VKTFEFGGRTWQVRKFDAWTGSYLAYRLMAEALPGGMGAAAGIPAPKDGKPMSKADFVALQKECLGVCYEVLPAGPRPVLDENGNFGVSGLEHDTKTVLALTVQALLFGVADFFDAEFLSSLNEGFQDLRPPDAQQ